MASSEGKVAPTLLGDGATGQIRMGRTGESIVADGNSHFGELAARGMVFSNTLVTTTGISAGNIVGAAAAAATQFAIFNPLGSGKNVHLLRFSWGIISGTPPIGSYHHGIFNSGVVPTTITITNTPKSNFVNGPGSICAASFQTSVAGVAMTGGTAPVILMDGNLSNTATAAAGVSSTLVVDLIDGLIVLPPGAGWAPLHASAGTTVLSTYSLTWAELPS